MPQPAKPDDPLAYQEALRRGHAALLAGNARQALAEYEAAAALASDRPLPLIAAGRALLAIDRAADALAAFERAHQRAPIDSAALQGKAEALSRLGRADEAAVVAEQIQRLAEGDTDLRQAADPTTSEPTQPDEAVPGRAEVLMIAAERAWQDRRLETAVGQWLAAARYHASDGHLDAALEACQRALLAEPGEPRVHLEMCRLYLAQGWHAKAIERMQLLARLIELDDNAELRRELAQLARDHAEDADLPDLAELAGRLDAAAPG